MTINSKKQALSLSLCPSLSLIYYLLWEVETLLSINSFTANKCKRDCTLIWINTERPYQNEAKAFHEHHNHTSVNRNIFNLPLFYFHPIFPHYHCAKKTGNSFLSWLT